MPLKAMLWFANYLCLWYCAGEFNFLPGGTKSLLYILWFCWTLAKFVKSGNWAQFWSKIEKIGKNGHFGAILGLRRPKIPQNGHFPDFFRLKTKNGPNYQICRFLAIFAKIGQKMAILAIFWASLKVMRVPLPILKIKKCHKKVFFFWKMFENVFLHNVSGKILNMYSYGMSIHLPSCIYINGTPFVFKYIHSLGVIHIWRKHDVSAMRITMYAHTYDTLVG